MLSPAVRALVVAVALLIVGSLFAFDVGAAPPTPTPTKPAPGVGLPTPNVRGTPSPTVSRSTSPTPTLQPAHASIAKPPNKPTVQIHPLHPDWKQPAQRPGLRGHPSIRDVQAQAQRPVGVRQRLAQHRDYVLHAHRKATSPVLPRADDDTTVAQDPDELVIAVLPLESQATPSGCNYDLSGTASDTGTGFVLDFAGSTNCFPPESIADNWALLQLYSLDSGSQEYDGGWKPCGSSPDCGDSAEVATLDYATSHQIDYSAYTVLSDGWEWTDWPAECAPSGLAMGCTFVAAFTVPSSATPTPTPVQLVEEDHSQDVTANTWVALADLNGNPVTITCSLSAGVRVTEQFTADSARTYTGADVTFFGGAFCPNNPNLDAILSVSIAAPVGTLAANTNNCTVAQVIQSCSQSVFSHTAETGDFFGQMTITFFQTSEDFSIVSADPTYCTANPNPDPLSASASCSLIVPFTLPWPPGT